MECIEARALKSSFLKEIGMKSKSTQQQTLFEDLFSVNGIDNVVNVSTSAEFSVDDYLLDFSDKEDFNNSGDGCFQADYYEEEKDFVENNSMISSDFPAAGEMVCFPAGEVQFPVDNMESLEWLSQIVDDDSLFFPPATSSPEKLTGNRHQPVTKPVVFPSFTVLGLSYPVPRNYRTKRSKKTGQGWSTTLTDSSSSSYGSTVTSPDPVHFQTNKKPGSGSSSGSSERRCSHCQVHTTPQWRTGPLGPKTLCNACGVRFKSGRLFPEYRPACSPTFSDVIHSNSHRKVLEMRKKRERGLVEPEFSSGLD
ncbi:hypothetical protein OSB04_008010 [Centaurea solstitialis]|uniref:GATA transcription factor n=1 Tax=Centaurea solstitialis TaxID=347529 RepID=A0AA38WR64_9ASTR|nr:hypothetical protein OSB04_008010 [Centaurea solstitialis]